MYSLAGLRGLTWIGVSSAFSLGIPDVRVLSMSLAREQEVFIEVESTLTTIACHRCGRTIGESAGYDYPRRLHHLPTSGHLVFISFRPKRFRCPHYDDHPITTQQLRWSMPDIEET